MVSEANLAGLLFLKPILAFLVVFIIVYAILAKSKMLGEDKFVNLFVSFVLASVFVAASDVTQLVLSVMPWFVVLLVLMFFVLVLSGFIGKEKDIAGKGLGWFFVIALFVIFLIAGYYNYEQDARVLNFTGWLFSSSIFGTLILLGVAALVGWAITKDIKKD